MYQTQALIIDTNILSPGYYFFTVLAPDIATCAKPGQFIQISVNGPEVTDPILPRPISLFSRNEAEGTISFIYKTVGRGTRILAGKKKGELLGIRGPIGNGFGVSETARNVFLIAGGIGMPPLFFLAEFLKQTVPQTQITLFYGGRSQTDLLELERWRGLGTEIFCATDDGSFGFKGLVTNLLSEKLKLLTPEYIAACGPHPMLKVVQGIASTFNIPGQLSLEAHMACGVGACLGCTCETVSGYRRVCVDGPVFPILEVVL